jgi:hypothetical protein
MVDIAAALDVLGTLTKYLSVAALLPGGVALYYGEPVWPFLSPHPPETDEVARM